jgi:hypothetical protein
MANAPKQFCLAAPHIFKHIKSEHSICQYNSFPKGEFGKQCLTNSVLQLICIFFCIAMSRERRMLALCCASTSNHITPRLVMLLPHHLLGPITAPSLTNLMVAGKDERKRRHHTSAIVPTRSPRPWSYLSHECPQIYLKIRIIKACSLALHITDTTLSNSTW